MRTPERYIAAIDAGRSPETGAERLDAAGRVVEGWQLALRTSAGAPRGAFAADDRAELVDAGLVTDERDRVVLTRTGRLLANEVALRVQVPAGGGTANRCPG